MEESLIKFVQFNSFVDASFWWKLTDHKLHDYKLDDSERSFAAYYTNSDAEGVPCRLTVDFNSLNHNKTAPPNSVLCYGHLYLKNTVENFRGIDKKLLLNETGMKIWSDIKSGAIFKNVSELTRVCLLTFIDIKKYLYYYWFAYPALSYPNEIRLSQPVVLLKDAFASEQIHNLQKVCTEYIQANNIGYFLLEQSGEKAFQIFHLDTIKGSNFNHSKYILAFCDPSTDVAHPGWPLRNLLALWAYYSSSENVTVLCWRQRYHNGKLENGHSLILNIRYNRPDEINNNSMHFYGWEKNEKGQLAPRFVDLSASMDANKIAEGALTLNLQLMRWRLVPELNLNLLKATSCLLFGSGTLGCNVARCLLGWGIKRITFVDNGKVSFSNPVRQSLFAFEDCLDGGHSKAEAAAESLKKIFPNVDSVGLKLTIPMPGHLVSDKELTDVKSTVEKIENLIKEHDVIFLLVDTREGRWLPTLLSTLHSKLTFSVALGFDSFVAVRHGFGVNDQCQSPLPMASKLITGDQLGCYFCSDVTAPGNSTNDRTLDQQCTVTRPGVSMIAAALAVELMTSVLQHPMKAMAPAEVGEQFSSTNVSCLGTTPHQIRGYLGRFDQMTPAVQRFSKCIACSNIVVEEYRRMNFDFLISVFNDPSILERLTGLDELHKNTEMAEVWELSDDESVRSIE